MSECHYYFLIDLYFTSFVMTSRVFPLTSTSSGIKAQLHVNKELLKVAHRTKVASKVDSGQVSDLIHKFTAAHLDEILASDIVTSKKKVSMFFRYIFSFSLLRFL